ncbi:carbohydrate ABC transporter permease [Micromonospora sagamiensis]|uniref:Carbohydrate ABC transporter membrane protein 2, CUT1 family (TC 3.A.1.1.-) n=1 Tax=Micromonospora sagamiensis TaxID=47875 RepID=A0A562WFQ2_9ACTN|nr:carbohydrate ABC transporter permease [Micromonospora sagamiensis]TWJ29046.1 carbohydrate ABC transporter membrane protein 2, CUT1 family (TC 3.A.1.1.-) [Micromonospora sagamiensis]BCL17929.1 ABC transporter permease [Micromonospora sagamiensis]
MTAQLSGAGPVPVAPPPADGHRKRRARSPRPVWEEPPSPAGQLGKGVVLTLMVLAVLFPLWSVVVTSLASRETINETGGMVVVPREFDPSAYVTIFNGGQITQAVWISTLVTVLGTAVSLVLTVLAAYGLSRPGSVAHRGLLFFFLLTFLIFPGLVPSYLVVTGLGLKDSIWSLILPSAISVFNLVVIRAFFMNVPGELVDSARIDGAGEFRILWQIMLPLSKAVVAVVGLFYAVGYWNAYFNSVLYIDDNDRFPIQRVLQTYILGGQSPAVSGASVNLPGVTAYPPTLAVKMAVVVVTVLPAVIIYPFVQRHFTKGVITGAVKG